MKVAVLGGGVAGLAAGASLARSGVEVLLFEAERSAGGKLRTVDAAGYRCEDGPNALTARSLTALRVARERGLEISEAQRPRTRYVFRRGKLRAASPPALFGLLSPFGWARLALEPLAALRRAKDEDETIQAFLIRHFGREAGELGGRIFANGIYAGDPRRLSARGAFPRVAVLEQFGPSLFVGAVRHPKPARTVEAGAPASLWIPKGGMSALARGLALEIGDGLRLGTRAESLRPIAGGYEIGLAGGSVKVDGVICAVPPREASRLLSPLGPGLHELERIRSAPIAVVHLGFRASDFARPPRGFGALDGEGSLGLLGVLFVSSLFAGKAPEGRVLLTCLVGGVLHPEALRSDDAALGAQCREDLRRLFGVTAEPELQRVARWEEAVPQPEVGHRALLDRVAKSLASLPLLELAGAAYDGVSVEEALAGGERAAARLLARQRGEDRVVPDATSGRSEA